MAAQHGTTQAVSSLRHAIQWHRSRTWHWQDVAGRPRTPTEHAERKTISVGYLTWIDHLWSHRRVAAYKLAHRRPSGSVPALICRVFGSVCGEAKYIAYRESRYSTSAANGQYLGIFQMGSGERSTYATIGYSTAYEQIVAAHNLYLARGFEPWTCCE